MGKKYGRAAVAGKEITVNCHDEQQVGLSLPLQENRITAADKE